MNPVIAAMDWAGGILEAQNLSTSEKKLGQLKGIYRDKQAFESMDPNTTVYRVWWWEPVPSGTEGGLFWGVTEILPGCVGDEYFMTHGHRHVIANRAEIYGTIFGQGMLLLRDESGRTWTEEMKPGSLHYIPGRVAHRTVNTGDAPLRFVACWPSDAGHDYEIAGGKGFGASILRENGCPVLKFTEETTGV